MKEPPKFLELVARWEHCNSAARSLIVNNKKITIRWLAATTEFMVLNWNGLATMKKMSES